MQHLAFDGSIEIPNVPAHPAYAILFYLEYVITYTDELKTLASEEDRVKAIEENEQVVVARWLPVVPLDYVQEARQQTNASTLTEGTPHGLGFTEVNLAMLGGPGVSPDNRYV